MPSNSQHGRPPGQLVNGELLRQRRRALNLTREQLAEQAGINARTIARAEHGDRLSTDSIGRVAKALHISFHELIRFPTQAVQQRLRQFGLAAPVPPDPWVERPIEAGRIIECLTSVPPHACCVAGPSGIGKTALARFVAHQMASRWAHGVIWVTASLEGQPVDIDAVQLRIADALELRQRLPPRELVDRDTFSQAFMAELWSHERLLVLDDVLTADTIARFAPRGKGVALLVTTHLLHLAEHFGGPVISLGGIDMDHSRRILAHYLGESRLRAEGEGVARLHQVLAGIPRSIHIAGTILQRERLVAISEYASRVHSEPRIDEYPSHLRTPETSLMLSFAQIQAHVSPGAWALLGVLSLFDEVAFPLEWAAAAAGEPVEVARTHLSELLDVYLATEELTAEAPGGRASRDGSTRRFRLHSHVPLFARGILDDRAAVLHRLALHAVAAARTAGEQEAWHEIRTDQVLWSRIMAALAAAAIGADGQPDALLAWDGAQRVPARIQASVTTTCFVDTACALIPYLARELVPDGDTWLRSAAACALALGRPREAGCLLLALGRWWLSARVDLQGSIRWFDAATEPFLQADLPAHASAAASEAGRALFGCQRPVEGLERFERAVAHARAAFDTGPELACRINSAAASFTRQPGLAGWQRAAELLSQAVAACTDTDRDGRLMRVVCACNMASVRFVLDHAGGGPPRYREALDQALEAWQAVPDTVQAPIFEARLMSLQAVFAATADADLATRLRARAADQWHARLHEPITEGFLWQLGEAAFYLRLYLAFLEDPDPGISPVIAQGFALSDLSRELPLENADLVPLGFLFPVPPLMDVFDTAYLGEVAQIAEDFYGPSNRILEELRGIESSRPAAGPTTAFLPWQRQ